MESKVRVNPLTTADFKTEKFFVTRASLRKYIETVKTLNSTILKQYYLFTRIFVCSLVSRESEHDSFVVSCSRCVFPWPSYYPNYSFQGYKKE